MLHKELETATPDGPNADQIRYWNDTAGQKWVELEPKITAQIRPFGEAALARAGFSPGHHVLDVGCGGGDTTMAIARAVRPGGTVTGVDISEVMLSLAARAVQGAGLSNVRLILADAQTAELRESAFDVVFSRFGVMFFADPAAAFRNLARALIPGGRLVFVCWRSPFENPWMHVPVAAAARHIPIPVPAPDAPGPCALADVERTRRILATAGFEEIDIVPFDHAVSLGAASTVDEAADFLLEIGPAARALREANPESRPAVRQAIRDAIAPHATDAGVSLGGATWIVTARKPR